MRTLAREARVSAATVSLALRGSREVSEATARRIRSLAERRGYRPDPQVAKLMQHLRGGSAAKGRATVAALIERWPSSGPRPPNYLDELLAGVRAALEAQGYALDLIGVRDLPTPGQLNRVLVSRGIEGLILLPAFEPADLTERLEWSRYSVVAATSAVVAPRFHQVRPNHFDNMVLACERLREAGLGRVGLAMPETWDLRVNHRWSGGVAWYNAHVAREAVKPMLVAPSGADLEADGFAEWIRRERPDAVIFESLDPRVAQDALQKIGRQKRPVLVTMNWPSGWADAGIDQRPRRIGGAAGDLLAAMIARGERGIPEGALSTVVEGLWRWKGRA